MKLRYSRLRGLPVRAGNGDLLGCVADLTVARRGDEAVCDQLLIVPDRLRLFALRLGRRVDLQRIEAAAIEAVDEQGVRLRAGPSLSTP